tara:strand:+ start:530 stop:1234 length:705 start_codon:yes stop_codon:yes gene_type:complete
MKKTLRLHDKFYLKENRYKNPKDSFKFILKVLDKDINKRKIYKVLDIGCSAGELIYQLEKKYNNLEIVGCDVRKDLLAKARKFVSNKTKLIKIDINAKKLDYSEKFDIIICNGVISIFNDLKNFRKNILKLLKKNGKLYLGSIFNEYNYNIYTQYEDIKNQPKVLQSGWNIWSIETIKNLFKSKKIKINRYFSTKNINKNKLDLIRSWTIKINGRRYFTNAVMQIQNKILLKIY